MSEGRTDKLVFAAEFQITNEDALRGFYKKTHPLAVKKSLPALDAHCVEFIERSPFLCLATQHQNGTSDVSPRGDPAGFVRILDPNTLVIPDRPGNNRLDSLSNILSNNSIGLLFLIPGFEDTLRVNGTAMLTREPELLASLSVNNREPTLAIVVEIREVFLHCAKALRRSRLWDPASRQDRSEMASLMAIVSEQTSGQPVPADKLPTLEKELEDEYRETMY